MKDTNEKNDILFFNKKLNREFGIVLHRNTESAVSLTSIKNKKKEEINFDGSFVDLGCWNSATKVPPK